MPLYRLPESRGLNSLQRFVLAPCYGMPLTLAQEEAMSLFSANGVRCKIAPRAGGTLGLEVEGELYSEGLAAGLASRMVSATAYEEGSSAVNRAPLAMKPNQMYAPLFDESGGVREGRLRDVFLSRWNASRLPFKDGTFDACMFDPPYGRATKPVQAGGGRPLEAAVEFLNEAARVMKSGGPVMRIPEEWGGSMTAATDKGEIVGIFNVPSDRITLIQGELGELYVENV